ncbi:hypothetical protein D9M69_549890 [compost metagenome]
MALALLLLDLRDGARRRVVRHQAACGGVGEHVGQDCSGLVAGAGRQRLEEVGEHADGDLVDGLRTQGGAHLLEAHAVQVEGGFGQFTGRQDVLLVGTEEIGEGDLFLAQDGSHQVAALHEGGIELVGGVDGGAAVPAELEPLPVRGAAETVGAAPAVEVQVGRQPLVRLVPGSWHHHDAPFSTMSTKGLPVCRW